MTLTSDTRTPAFVNLFNFRDIGGYPGLDGRVVRHRRVYRSDSLHRLDDADEAAFRSLGIRTVIDLRRPSEIARHGRVPQYDGLDYRHVHLVHQEWSEIPYDEAAGPARYLADRYHDLTEQAADGIVTTLALLADEATAPAVVHCAAGKDRTGVVCALTLALLGVPDEVIAEEYALTSAAMERFIAWHHARFPQRRHVPKAYFACPPEAMRIFLTELRERHGSVERYVLDAGLPAEQIAELRENLLSPS